MEQSQAVLAAGAVGFGNDPLHERGIAFRVEHNHHLAPVDILGNQDLSYVPDTSESLCPETAGWN